MENQAKKTIFGNYNRLNHNNSKIQMEKKQYIEIRIKDLSDLIKLHQAFLSKFVFRGQGDESWELETSLRRMLKDYHSDNIEIRTPKDYENAMLRDFKWKYLGYQNNPNMMPKELESVEWLSIMQHFGAKTRLLDFSNSLFISLYMALYGSWGTDAAIWAINKDMIRSPFANLANENEGNIPSEEELDFIIYKKAENQINKRDLSEADYQLKEIYMVSPRLSNERISRQQGLFLIPSSISFPFKDIIAEYCDNEVLTTTAESFLNIGKLPFLDQIGLIKIIIPNSLRYELSKLLQQMNINAETMYPGLEGLAKSVNCIRKI